MAPTQAHGRARRLTQPLLVLATVPGSRPCHCPGFMSLPLSRVHVLTTVPGSHPRPLSHSTSALAQSHQQCVFNREINLFSIYLNESGLSLAFERLPRHPHGRHPVDSRLPQPTMPSSPICSSLDARSATALSVEMSVTVFETAT